MFEQDCAEEPALAARIAAALDELGTREAFGPLACGADILIAEAMLARGGRLEVVLPFAEDDFIDESVLCGGEGWLPRYQRCRDAATPSISPRRSPMSTTTTSSPTTRASPWACAALRARELGAEAVQLAVIARQGHVVLEDRVWRERRPTSASGNGSASAPSSSTPGRSRATCAFRRSSPASDRRVRREIRSILFADYKGFSRLGERELPLFMREVMGRIGARLDRVRRARRVPQHLGRRDLRDRRRAGHRRAPGAGAAARPARTCPPSSHPKARRRECASGCITARSTSAPTG